MKAKKKKLSMTSLKVTSIKSSKPKSTEIGFLNTSQFGTLCTGGDRCCL
jgi:hypothetical protein